jgi:hypothetical protein
MSVGNAELRSVFARLRELLAAHASEFAIAFDTTDRYGLEAPAGPATLRAWGGKARAPIIPIAWVEVRKAYVSYHLIGIEGNKKLLATLSQPLRARMHGKTCFNFKVADEVPIPELESITAESFGGLRRTGFIAPGSGDA